MAEHTPARILLVRAKMYDLLSHCIPPTTILKVYLTYPNLDPSVHTDKAKTLTFKLIPKIDDALKADVIRWSAFYEHRIRLGSVSTIKNPLHASTEYTETHFSSRSFRCKVHEGSREVSLSDWRLIAIAIANT